MVGDAVDGEPVIGEPVGTEEGAFEGEGELIVVGDAV